MWRNEQIVIPPRQSLQRSLPLSLPLSPSPQGLFVTFFWQTEAHEVHVSVSLQFSDEDKGGDEEVLPLIHTLLPSRSNGHEGKQRKAKWPLLGVNDNDQALVLTTRQRDEVERGYQMWCSDREWHCDSRFQRTLTSSPPSPSDRSDSSSVGHITQHSYCHFTTRCATLLFTFDNSHSILRSKIVHFQTYVRPAAFVPLGVIIKHAIHGRLLVQAISNDSTDEDDEASTSKSSEEGKDVLKSRSFLCARLNEKEQWRDDHEQPALTLLESDIAQCWSWRDRIPFLPGLESEASVNSRAMCAVDLFFNNKTGLAEAFLRSEPANVMFSVGMASLSFLTAMMSWERDEMKMAADRLTHTRELVASSLPHESTLSSLSRMLTISSTTSSFSQYEPLSNAELQATLVTAETLILQAILALVEENVLSIINAGLKIKQAHALFLRCYAELERHTSTATAHNNNVSSSRDFLLDDHVRGGIENGYGTFLVCLSLLPPILLRLLSFIGFHSDRVLGFRLLKESASRRQMHQPLAACIVLFMHIVVPAFFTVREKEHIAASDVILKDCFEIYPHGSIFLWLKGRQERNKRQLGSALKALQESSQGSKMWPQLQHLVSYEMGLTKFMSLDFLSSLSDYTLLERENEWSKAYFCYQQAIVYAEYDCGTLITFPSTSHDMRAADAEMSKAREQAICLFNRVTAACDRKFAGKNLSLEAFCLQRAKEYLQKQLCVLPTIEMIYLYQGFRIQDKERLDCTLQRIDQTLTETSTLPPSKVLLLSLLRGAALSALNRFDEALQLLSSINSQASDAGLDLFIIPFARFEIATIQMMKLQNNSNQEDFEKVRDLLRLVSSFKAGYHFRNRLHLRVHLAVTELKAMRSGTAFENVDTTEEDELNDLNEEEIKALSGE